MGTDEGLSVSVPAPIDPLASALVHSGMVPPELLDAYLAAPAEVRRRCFDAGQAVTAGALLEVHPLAELFPAMTAEQYQALRDDIAAHGIQEPIWLYEGRIIDGKHRQRACIELGIDPPRRKYAGKDPIGFVVARNLRRRHMTESQRAMVAAKIANMRQGERTDLRPSANLRKVSQKQAAELLNVSDRSVSNARKVQERGAPALVEAVERGKLAVSAAAGIARAVSPDTQSRIVETDLVKSAARYLRTHPVGLNVESPDAVIELIKQACGARSDSPATTSNPCQWISASDTLPKGDTEALVFLPGSPDGCIEIARYELSEQSTWMKRCDSLRVAPSHWMPLPAPPSDAGEKEKPRAD
ncbi:MAG: DUF551 domain-containing protein [Gammaproteobacteria bacterium]